MAVRTISPGRRVLFMVLVLAVTLAFFEAAVRARAWLKYGTARPGVSDEMLAFDPKLGLTYPRPGFEVTSGTIAIKINDLGFRGGAISPVKPADTVRIVCVGASTTFSAEVSSNEATWPAQLQKLLEREFPGVAIEVVNAGIPGAVATESLKSLERRVVPLTPDIVVFYEANNDMAIDTRDLARRQGLLSSSEGYLSGPVRALSQYSLLFDLAYKNGRILLSRSDTPAGKLSSVPAELPARFIGEIAKMHDLLRRNRIQFVLSTYLVKYRRTQDRATQIANANVSFYYMPWMTIDGLLDGMDRYNEAIVAFASSQGIPVVTDREGVPADDAHYVDWAHMTDRGNASMAERFRHFFVEQGLITRAIAARQSASSARTVIR
jgi:lysophospholipase L1-like esterase